VISVPATSDWTLDLGLVDRGWRGIAVYLYILPASSLGQRSYFYVWMEYHFLCPWVSSFVCWVRPVLGIPVYFNIWRNRMETADSETFMREPRNRVILKVKNALVKYVYFVTEYIVLKYLLFWNKTLRRVDTLWSSMASRNKYCLIHTAAETLKLALGILWVTSVGWWWHVWKCVCTFLTVLSGIRTGRAWRRTRSTSRQMQQNCS